MDQHELSVAQLIEDGRTAEPLGARLDAIRHTASAGGVTVTVDLHGQLVGLILDHAAMRLPAHELAARIKSSAGEAAQAALHEGLAVLSASTSTGLTAELATRLAAAVGLGHEDD